jgi:hypothetical protein
MMTDHDLNTPPRKCVLQSHSHVRRSRSRQVAPVRQKYRQHLESLQEKHKQLAQSREQNVILKRMELRTILESIQRHRQKAGDAEASLVTSLRQFCEQRGIDLPPEIDSQYHEVQDQRDSIGKLEYDFLQTQKTYSASEWQFIEEEDDFYQYHILESFPEDDDDDTLSEASHEQSLPFPSLSQPIAATSTAELTRELVSTAVERRQLEEEFASLREQEVGYMDEHELRILADFGTPLKVLQEKEELHQQADEVIGRLVKIGIRESHLKQELLSNASPLVGRRASDPWRSSTLNTMPRQTNTISYAQTESGLASIEDSPPSNRKRVSQWILDSMDASSFEKARFRSFLGTIHMALDDSSFWQKIRQHWNDEASGSSTAHSKNDSQASHASAKVIDYVAMKSEEQYVLPPQKQLNHETGSIVFPALKYPSTHPRSPLTQVDTATLDRIGGSDTIKELYTSESPCVLNDRAGLIPAHAPTDTLLLSSTRKETPPLASTASLIASLDPGSKQEALPTITSLDPVNTVAKDVGGVDLTTLKLGSVTAISLDQEIQALNIQPEKRSGKSHSDPGNFVCGLELHNLPASFNFLSDNPYHRTDHTRTPPLGAAEHMGIDHLSFFSSVPTINVPIPSPPLTVDFNSSLTLDRSRSPSPLNVSIQVQDLRRPSRGELTTLAHRRSQSENNCGGLQAHPNGLPVPRELPPEGPDDGSVLQKEHQSPGGLE